MSTIKQIRAFVAIANSKSFAEACSSINLSQPALSISIKNLETDIGGSLLTRTTRTLSLTPEGREFLPVAKRLLNDWDTAIENVRNHFLLRRGKISIAAMPSFACNQLPLVFVEYKKQYPSVNVSIQDVVAEQVLELVRSGRVEIGIIFDPGKSEDLSFTPIFQDRFIAVLPRSMENLAPSTINWKFLLESGFITLQKPANMRTLLENTLTKHALSLSVSFETNQLATIGRLVSKGLGVSAVPALCKEQMEEMGAICREIEGSAIQPKVGIITRRRYPLSVAAKALEKIILEMWPSALDSNPSPLQP